MKYFLYVPIPIFFMYKKNTILIKFILKSAPLLLCLENISRSKYKRL